jgi:ABC-type multidrug transport system ATPase subunit
VTEPRIRLRRLRKRFGTRLALDDIDLEVGERRIVGVVGPDGAGKTTLLRSLAGLLEIEADEAVVLGHDLRGDVTALKAAIGYVPQSFSLHRELSVIENLRFTARLHRIPEATFQGRSTALLARTLLAPFKDRPAGALSGGMKQKLAIANALLPEPALLILDEPTAGVDVVARGEIQAILRETAARALVVMSTSYLDEAADVDELVYLDHGRIVASGAPATLRQQVPREVYRLWGPNARAIARAARAVPGVADARAAGGFARVEVDRAAAAGVAARLRTLPGAGVMLLEHTGPDMESVLRFYASA